ncbi:MAG: hypothetical protein HFJ06_03915 [Lachnospiraceae bacterium]|nr:hypothetical protein [Lachnospiraceae bacterium]
MTHELLGLKVKIEECKENFETVYQKEYFPQELLDEIKVANVLLIPNHINRNGKEEYIFPETTLEFFEFVKDNIVDGMKPDIAVDDEGFKKLELHSATITVATFVVTSVLFPIMVNLVSSYLYDQVKKMHRNKEDVSAKVNIISTDENGKKSKMISYEGPVSGIKEALENASKEIFKDDNQGN